MENIFNFHPTWWIVNPVNLEGISGAGLAKQFRDKFPDSFTYYREACKHGQLSKGEILLDSKNRIIHFPTKESWREDSTMQLVMASSLALYKCLFEGTVDRVVIPPVGTGLGNLNKSDVFNLLSDMFEEFIIEGRVRLINF